MTDPSAATDTEPLAAASEATTLLDTQKVLTAVADSARRRLLKILSDGQPRDVSALASKIHYTRDMTAKHLKVLRDTRLVLPAKVAGADGRKSFHAIPPVFIKKDAAGRTALDFGAVVLRLE